MKIKKLVETLEKMGKSEEDILNALGLTIKTITLNGEKVSVIVNGDEFITLDKNIDSEAESEQIIEDKTIQKSIGALGSAIANIGGCLGGNLPNEEIMPDKINLTRDQEILKNRILAARKRALNKNNKSGISGAYEDYRSGSIVVRLSGVYLDGSRYDESKSFRSGNDTKKLVARYRKYLESKYWGKDGFKLYPDEDNEKLYWSNCDQVRRKK